MTSAAPTTKSEIIVVTVRSFQKDRDGLGGDIVETFATFLIFDF